MTDARHPAPQRPDSHPRPSTYAHHPDSPEPAVPEDPITAAASCELLDHAFHALTPAERKTLARLVAKILDVN